MGQGDITGVPEPGQAENVPLSLVFINKSACP